MVLLHGITGLWVTGPWPGGLVPCQAPEDTQVAGDVWGSPVGPALSSPLRVAGQASRTFPGSLLQPGHALSGSHDDTHVPGEAPQLGLRAPSLPGPAHSECLVAFFPSLTPSRLPFLTPSSSLCLLPPVCGFLTLPSPPDPRVSFPAENLALASSRRHFQ